ncbi:MAG: hypothetical protein HYY84_06735 [Deltaproteobacteria bacterium]|nr:hypothetical protein [Deltaproteobacteria bacterium]
MFANLVAGTSVVGVVILATLFAGARSDISALEVEVKALRDARRSQAAKEPAALLETRVRETALDPAHTRVAVLESHIRDLRQSIDWIGQTLAAAAGEVDGPGADDASVKGNELSAALASNDPKKKEEVKKILSKVMQERREERWQQMSARVTAVESAIVKQVAKEQSWPEAKSQDVLAAIQSLRKDFRKEVRDAWRKMENPVEAEKKVLGVLDGARDRLIGILGASDYEAFRTKYNENTDAWQKLRQRGAPKLPAVR